MRSEPVNIYPGPGNFTSGLDNGRTVELNNRRSYLMLIHVFHFSSLLDSIIATHSCTALQRQISTDSSCQHVQNDLAQVALQAAWNSSFKPLLKHLHWLPVQQRITFKIALVTFNVQTFEQPSYHHSLLDNYTPSRILRSDRQHLLRIPFRKSAAARRSLCFAALIVWNSLN